jgi:hypothetical protein
VLKALLVALWNRTCGAIVLAAPQKSSKTVCPSTNEATHPRCCDEGYPDRPGRASNKEGEPWVIIPKPL